VAHRRLVVKWAVRLLGRARAGVQVAVGKPGRRDDTGGAPRVEHLNMSLQVQPVPSLPNDIAQVVRQILPASHPLVVVGDRLSNFVSDASFADLYPAEGKPPSRRPCWRW